MMALTKTTASRDWKPLMPDGIDLLIGLGIGLAFLFRFHYDEVHKRELLEALLLAVAVAFLTALWREAKSWGEKIKALTGEVAFMRRQVFEDERIIFAAADLDKSSRKISVVAVEDVDPVPEPLEDKPVGNGVWKQSFSVLRFDRIQDLLFSAKYLDYFFKLRDQTPIRNRLLIVNNRPRSVDAVRSFLQLSAYLDIKTFVYTKREFYLMLRNVREQMGNKTDADSVCAILHGNPELNVMVDQVNEFTETPPDSEASGAGQYVLRFADANGYIVTRKPGGPADGEERIPHEQIYSVLRLMSLGCRPARVGLPAFERIRKGYSPPDNFWGKAYTGWLFGRGVKPTSPPSDIEIVEKVRESETTEQADDTLTGT